MVISALVKVADADAADKKIPEALIGYQRAAQFAEKSRIPDCKASPWSTPLIHRSAPGISAQLHNRSSKPSSLTRPKAIERPLPPISDYGQFFRRHNQPERLAFACFYRAQDLMSTTPGDELTTIATAVTASEARLGPAARVLPSRLSKLLSEALSLSPAVFSSATSH